MKTTLHSRIPRLGALLPLFVLMACSVSQPLSGEEAAEEAEDDAEELHAPFVFAAPEALTSGSATQQEQASASQLLKQARARMAAATSLRIPVAFEALDFGANGKKWCPVAAVVSDDLCSDEAYGGAGGKLTICRQVDAASGNRHRIVWRSTADCLDDNGGAVAGCKESPTFAITIHKTDSSHTSTGAVVQACRNKRCNRTGSKRNIFDGSCESKRLTCILKPGTFQNLTEGTEVLKYTITVPSEPLCPPLDPYIVVRP